MRIDATSLGLFTILALLAAIGTPGCSQQQPLAVNAGDTVTTYKVTGM